jgi:hypothetical protein
MSLGKGQLGVFGSRRSVGFHVVDWWSLCVGRYPIIINMWLRKRGDEYVLLDTWYGE